METGLRNIKLFIYFFLFLFSFSLFSQTVFDQERENMAMDLTQIKILTEKNNWLKSDSLLQSVQSRWKEEVLPIILEDHMDEKRFDQYYQRIDRIDQQLNLIENQIKNRQKKDLDSLVNLTIWSISHHPRGFDVPEERYTLKDWIFGLSIGFGYLLFAILFGLHLRRTFYKEIK
jgi:hypothetical protein